MNKRYLVLLFSYSALHGMNKVSPAEITDAELVATALPNIGNIHHELIPHIATALKENPEAATDAASTVSQAAGAALSCKMNKTTAAALTATASIVSAIISSLASYYSNNKC